jgi:hypothetical protein
MITVSQRQHCQTMTSIQDIFKGLPAFTTQYREWIFLVVLRKLKLPAVQARHKKFLTWLYVAICSYNAPPPLRTHPPLQKSIYIFSTFYRAIQGKPIQHATGEGTVKRQALSNKSRSHQEQSHVTTETGQAASKLPKRISHKIKSNSQTK